MKMDSGSFNFQALLPVFRFTLLLICMLPVALSGEINKCNINGEIIFTDAECPENTSQAFEINRLNLTPADSTERQPSNVTKTRYKSAKWYNDHAGYKKALKISDSKDVPILIYGRTDWCPYCKKLDKTFLTDSKVIQVLSRFVKVKLNPDHGTKDEELFKSWGGTGYPTLFVQSDAYSTPRRIKQPFIKQDGRWEIISKSVFIATLQKQLK